MKQLKLFSALFCVLGMVSCSKKTDSRVEYFAFQETDKGSWGMISTSGKVLFSEEFKEKPTVARDGRFMVRNADGMWEIYTAEEKPQKVGVEYAHASMFQDGRAVVAEKNKPISIIDTDGKTLVDLAKIDGKTVDEVSRFNEGYAVYKTGKYYGAIDTNGKSVVKPDYCRLSACSDGKFIGINKKHEAELDNDSIESLKWDVLDNSGKVILTLSRSKYREIGSFFQDGLLDVYVKSKDEKCGGIINDKGDVIVKPTAKIKMIGAIKGKYFTYNNGDGWGLMNVEGESVIRAKYDLLYFASDNILIAATKKDNGSVSYKLIDREDNQIGNDTFDALSGFDSLDGEYALCKINDKLYSILNKKGEQVEKLPDMVNVSLSEADYTVESDYVDMNELLDKMNFTQNGIDSLTFKTTPIQFVKFYVKQDGISYTGTKEHPAADPYWYDTNNGYGYYKEVNGVNAYIYTSFSGNLSRQTYRNQRVIDYSFGDYYWYHDNKIPTGYVFNDVKLQTFTINFSNNGILRNKLHDLFLALSKRFKNMGKVEKENNGAVVVTLQNGLRAVVAMEEERVFATWGDLIPASEIDISKYKDAKEKPQRIKDYDYFESDRYNNEEVEADTVGIEE